MDPNLLKKLNAERQARRAAILVTDLGDGRDRLVREGDAISGELGEALDVLETGKPRMLEFGVADETAWRAGLSCGGRIKVYVERLG